MPAKYDRCVEKVSRQKDTKSAHAICTSAGLRGKHKPRKGAKKGTKR